MRTETTPPQVQTAQTVTLPPSVPPSTPTVGGAEQPLLSFVILVVTLALFALMFRLQRHLRQRAATSLREFVARASVSFQTHRVRMGWRAAPDVPDHGTVARTTNLIGSMVGRLPSGQRTRIDQWAIERQISADARDRGSFLLMRITVGWRLAPETSAALAISPSSPSSILPPESPFLTDEERTAFGRLYHVDQPFHGLATLVQTAIGAPSGLRVTEESLQLEWSDELWLSPSEDEKTLAEDALFTVGLPLVERFVRRTALPEQTDAAQSR